MKFPLTSVLFGVILSLLVDSKADAFTTARIPSTRRSSGLLNPSDLISPRSQWESSSQRQKTAVSPLQMSPLLTLFSSPIGALTILAGIVLVHEAGHYLAARSFGIKVEEFSVGFGPRLLGLKAFGNEFNLRALPLGGYVRFPENYNTTLVREKQLKAYRAEKEARVSRERDIASEIANILTLGVLEDRQREQEKQQRIEAVQEYEKLPWYKKLGIPKPAPPPTRLEDVEIEYYDDPNLLQNRPWQQRAVVLSAGVVFNILLSFFIYFGEIGFGSGVPSPSFDRGILVSATPIAESPAQGKLVKGDIIVGVNGKDIVLSERPSMLETQMSINEFISTIRKTPEGESLSLSVVHPNTMKPVEIIVTPKHVMTEVGKVGPQSIGVLLSPNYVKTEIIKSDSLTEAAGLATRYVTTMTTETARGLTSFFGALLSGKAGSSGSQVSGPIGLIKTGSEVVSSQDWTAIWLFTAAISINLGIVNAFPLPALDGGQLIFVIAEALSGRKVDQRLEEGITNVAVLFLLLFSIGAAVGDIETIFAQ